MNILISAVSENSSHTSGRFAKFLASKNSCLILNLFADSRSIRSIFHDSFSLLHFLFDNRGNISSIYINVNGSLCQFICLSISRFFTKDAKLFVMDCYPGCLRYVTTFWIIFYPLFYILSLLNIFLAKNILIIDERFLSYSPYLFFRRSIKFIYFPLPEEIFMDQEMKLNRISRGNQQKSRPVIGLVGNIELVMLSEINAFLKSSYVANNFSFLIATSKVIERKDFFELKSLSKYLFIPWRSEDTNGVLSKIDYMLIPLSRFRVIYSSPSKILDCLSRGIVPVIVCDIDVWIKNKDSVIYKKCIYYKEFNENFLI